MKYTVVALISLLLLLVVPSTQAATVFSDNFNGEHGGTGALNYASFANWDVSGGAVDLVGNGSFDFYPGHGLYVDLDGSVFHAGLLASHSIALASGSYTLSFELGGSQRGDTNTVLVTLGSFYSESFTLASSAPLATITRTFSVDSTTSESLTFHNGGGDNVGLVLDDVQLDSLDDLRVHSLDAVEKVPEPASMTMLGLAFAGIGFARRRAVKR